MAPGVWSKPPSSKARPSPPGPPSTPTSKTPVPSGSTKRSFRTATSSPAADPQTSPPSANRSSKPLAKLPWPKPANQFECPRSRFWDLGFKQRAYPLFFTFRLHRHNRRRYRELAEVRIRVVGNNMNSLLAHQKSGIDMRMRYQGDAVDVGVLKAERTPFQLVPFIGDHCGFHRHHFLLRRIHPEPVPPLRSAGQWGRIDDDAGANLRRRMTCNRILILGRQVAQTERNAKTLRHLMQNLIPCRIIQRGTFSDRII